MKITYEFIVLRFLLIVQANLYFLIRRFSPRRKSFPKSIHKGLINRFVQAHHEKQLTEASCSVATVTTVINAAKACASSGENPGGKAFQDDLLNRVTTSNWKARVSQEGYKNRRGLNFRKLVRVVTDALKEYQVPVKKITAVPLYPRMKQSPTKKRELFCRLKQAAGKDHVFVIAHFNQGAFIDTWHIPHISPVGGIDPDRKEILILDVDREVEKPYVISFDTFFKGMTWRYLKPIRNRGYTGGGYIVIEIPK